MNGMMLADKYTHLPTSSLWFTRVCPSKKIEERGKKHTTYNMNRIPVERIPFPDAFPTRFLTLSSDPVRFKVSDKNTLSRKRIKYLHQIRRTFHQGTIRGWFYF